MEKVEVRAEVQEDERGPVVVVTLEGTSWQLNLRAGPDEWKRLSEVNRANGGPRSSVNVGSVENVPAWWHLADDALHLVVGNGPESADLGLVLPRVLLDEMRQETATAEDDCG